MVLKTSDHLNREIEFIKLLNPFPYKIIPEGLIIPYFQTDLSIFSNEKIFRESIEILKVLEEHRIVHLDFKPDNLGIYNEKLVLFDFGNSFQLETKFGFIEQSRYPPKAIRGPEFNGPKSRFDTRADLWSLGRWFSRMLIGFWTEFPEDYLEPKWEKVITPLLRPNFEERPFVSSYSKFPEL